MKHEATAGITWTALPCVSVVQSRLWDSCTASAPVRYVDRPGSSSFSFTLSDDALVFEYWCISAYFAEELLVHWAIYGMMKNNRN